MIMSRLSRQDSNWDIRVIICSGLKEKNKQAFKKLLLHCHLYLPVKVTAKFSKSKEEVLGDVANLGSIY